MNKNTISLVITTALSLSVSVANAAAINSFTFIDIDGDGTAGDFSFSVPPVLGGANSFNPIFTPSCLPVGCVDPVMGSLVPNSPDRIVDEFTTGFRYSFYGDFHPYTFGAGLAGTITGTQDGDASNDTLDMTSVNWGGAFAPAGDITQRVDFDLVPDPGTLTATVVNDNNDGTYDITLEWNHIIQDPDGDFNLQNAFWYTEFTVSTVPVPAAAWLFGSGLIGLVGFAKRKKA